MELFTQRWATAWAEAINADEAYREAGRGWEGGIVLRRSDGEGGEVLLDLAGGVCREARAPAGAAGDDARIVIEAPDATWRRVLAGEVDPVMGLMRGTLSLTRGSLLTLVPHQRGARALLAAAARVGGAGPGAEAAPEGSPGAPSEGKGPPPPRPTGADRAGSSARPDPPPSPPVRPRSPAPFRSTSAAGLDHGLFPMALYHKAKRLGVWDPRDIDLARDARDWAALAEDERDLLLRLTALFQAGEEAVTRDLLPLIQVISAEGRLEEEMFLTTFLFEEAKHVELFRRFFDEVAPDHGDLTRFETPSYRRIFLDELPGALHRLADDPSPEAQARAAVTYNMIVEGVLAETGYRGYQATLEEHGILPGMQEAIRLVKRDESRHIAYGLYLLSRLGAEGGEALWEGVEAELARLLDPAVTVVEEIFAAYETVPFGLELEDFTAYALQQFQARVRRLATARDEGGLVAALE